jgi:Cys-tRNA(Pro) deacylase
MVSKDYPVTRAVRVLRKKKIAFEAHHYTYKDRGGTGHAAAALDIPEHAVIKTLLMETDARNLLFVLMHGDREVSTKKLARALAVKRVAPCDPEAVPKHTGYVVGGVSPFGARKPIPIYLESSILACERVFINGGKRGFLLEVDPRDLHKAFAIVEINVAIEG